ncbi:MAG: hypothetical protein U9O59_01355 [Actinomycetota bacterium]|nr:hypothetical protein [Actinomycetota bacterium]
MNKFNRVVVVIVLLKVIAFSVLIMVNKFLDLFEWAKVSSKVIGFLADQNIYLTGGTLLVVLIVSIILMVYEFKRSR